MRESVVILLFALLLAACGGGADTGAFCDTMQQILDLSESAGADLADPDFDAEAFANQIAELGEQAASQAPEQIAAILNSTDPDEQAEASAFVQEECGIDVTG